MSNETLATWQDRNPIRKARVAKSIKRKPLADMAGISLRNLYILEMGQRPAPTITTMSKICKVLEVDSGDLSEEYIQWFSEKPDEEE